MNSKEIARLAGVSKATVSRVVNNSGNVKEETREKVLRIMEQQGYMPNVSARVLAGGKTNIIGIFIVTLGDDSVNDNNRVGRNDFYMQFLNDAISVCTSHNQFVLTSFITEVAHTLKIKEMLLQKRIDTAIIIGMNNKLHTVFEMISEGLPLIIFDFDYNMAKKYETKKSQTFILNYDDYLSSYDILEYLYSKGHRKIGGIEGNNDMFSGKMRKKAFVDFHKDYNLEFEEKWLLNGQFMHVNAYNELNKFCKEEKDMPTAFFAFNDGMAIGTIEALMENGYNVPSDISVVGYDNITTSEILKPSLTTIALSFKDMMNYAMEKTINANNKEIGFVKVKYFNGKIIERESVKKIK